MHDQDGGVSPDELPGLLPVAEAVAVERLVELQNFESLDAKASVIFGSAGALIALAADGWAPAVVMATPFAIVAGILAFVAFAPKKVRGLSTTDYISKYAGGSESRAREVLLSE